MIVCSAGVEAAEEMRKEEVVKGLKHSGRCASRKRGEVWGRKESRGQWTHDWNHRGAAYRWILKAPERKTESQIWTMEDASDAQKILGQCG
jgi:hypothetical protein